ncbi:hypothetical protein [Mycobacterium syngnathidarum]
MGGAWIDGDVEEPDIEGVPLRTSQSSTWASLTGGANDDGTRVEEVGGASCSVLGTDAPAEGAATADTLSSCVLT